MNINKFLNFNYDKILNNGNMRADGCCLKSQVLKIHLKLTEGIYLTNEQIPKYKGISKYRTYLNAYI